MYTFTNIIGLQTVNNKSNGSIPKQIKYDIIIYYIQTSILRSLMRATKTIRIIEKFVK